MLQPTTPVACQHIADYYTHRWQNHKCIAWNMLRHGYSQWARGEVETCNNLFDLTKVSNPQS